MSLILLLSFIVGIVFCIYMASWINAIGFVIVSILVLNITNSQLITTLSILTMIIVFYQRTA